MLPDHILQHAWFHAGFTEQTAKAYLLANTDSNFLICPGSKPDTLTLVYTAMFNNGTQLEARSMPDLPLKHETSSLIHFNCQMIADHSSLYDLVQELVAFLKAPFVPMALPRADMTAEQRAELEAQYKTESLMERQRIEEQQEKLAFIYDVIDKEIPPEDRDNILKQLLLNGYSIHSPRIYGSERIIIKINSPRWPARTYSNQVMVFLSRDDMSLINEPPLFADDPDLLDRLVDVCRAKKHLVAWSDDEQASLSEDEEASSSERLTPSSLFFTPPVPNPTPVCSSSSTDNEDLPSSGLSM